jgi:hypothetical protein
VVGEVEIETTDHFSFRGPGRGLLIRGIKCRVLRYIRRLNRVLFLVNDQSPERSSFRSYVYIQQIFSGIICWPLL